MKKRAVQNNSRSMSVIKKAMGFFCLLVLSSNLLYALPEGESVVSGSATFDRSTQDVLSVVTPSERLIVNYESFSIAGQETVNFIQPSSSSIALNRVVGIEPSSIFGTLNANGRIFVVNPNGIIFGPDSHVDVAGLVASTLNINDDDFLNGNFNFYKDNANSFIINQGSITVRNGGYVVLLSAAVENTGTIQADLGTVVMASGEKMTLALDDLNDISVVIDEPVKEAVFGPDGQRISSAIKNSGSILANGGKVILTAKVLNRVFDYAINNTGIIQASSLVNRNGVIELLAEGAPIVNTGTLIAGEIRIEAPGEEFINKGEVIARAEESVTESGTIDIATETVVQAGYISADESVTIEAEVITVILEDSPTAIEDNPLAIGIDPILNTSPAVIIQAPVVKIIAKQFGSSDAPLHINAGLTYIRRIEGGIDILDSSGIGTSVLLRGPPDGFGAIVYNRSSNLTLDASQVSLISDKPAYLYGNITFNNLSVTVPGKEIYFESGKTYVFKGSTYIYGQPGYAGLIKLLSGTEGSAWYSEFRGVYNISFVAIRDAYNIGEAVKVLPSTNWGNSFNWDTDPVWDNTSGDGKWSTAANWDTNTVPTASDTVTFNSTSVTNSFVDTGFAGTIATLSVSSAYTGTITLQRSLTVTGNITLSGGTLNTGANMSLNAARITIAGGTLTANGSTITLSAISGTLFTRSSGTFNPGTSTVVMDPNSNITLTSGSITFYNLQLTPTISNNRTYTFGSGAITINNNFDINPNKTISSGGIRTLTVKMGAAITVAGTTTITKTGSFAASLFDTTGSDHNFSTGNLVVDTGATFKANASIVTLTGASGTLFANSGTFDAGNSTVVVNAGGSTTLNSSPLTFRNLTIGSAGFIISLGASSTGNTGSLTINSGSIFNLNGNNFGFNSSRAVINNGTFQLQGGETFTNVSNLDVDSGTVKYAGTAGPYTLKSFAGADYFNLEIAGSATFNAGAALDIDGSLILTSGTFAQGANTLNIAGNFSIASGAVFTKATGGQNLAFDGTSAATFTDSTPGLQNLGVVVIGKTSGTSANNKLTLLSSMTVDRITVNVNNTFDLGTGGYTLTLANAGAIASALTVNGTFTSGTSTVRFSATNSTGNINVPVLVYSSLRFSGAETYVLTGNLTGANALTGGVTIDSGATLDVTAANFNIALAGNWANSGAFIARSGTVTFSGSGTATISGSTSFFNLSSTVAGKQLTFTAGTTQTITGTLTLTGASGNLLMLRSSLGGSQWNIDPQGTRSISFVDAKDSNNLNAAVITPSGSKDSGNNTNWFLVDHFEITGAASMIAGTSSQLTITAVDATGGTALSFTGDKLLTFSGANSIGNFTPTVTDKDSTAVNFGLVTTITFTSGVSSAGGSMVLYRAETANIAATDGTSLTPSPLSVTVNPAAVGSLRITGTAVMTAGTANELTITAFDQFGNINSSGPNNYTGAKSLIFSGLSNSPLGNVPTVEGTDFGTAVSIAFTNGVSDSGAATLSAFRAESASVDLTDGTADSSGDAGFDLDLTVDAGAANNLNFIQQPADTLAGESITPSPQVEVRDTWGNVLTGDNITSITLSIGINSSAGTLSGTTTQVAVAGVAAFSGLSIDNAGAGFTLNAVSAGLTGATSTGFDITATGSGAGSASLPGAAGNPSIEAQLANSTVIRPEPLSLEQLELFQVNLFSPIGSALLYHPLSEIFSGFLEEFQTWEELRKKKPASQ